MHRSPQGFRAFAFLKLVRQIVKQEWPQNWPSFIPDLVNSSKESESLCENNMAILRLLSEGSSFSDPLVCVCLCVWQWANGLDSTPGLAACPLCPAEIFDYSKEEMVSTKVQRLKDSLNDEFGSVPSN